MGCPSRVLLCPPLTHARRREFLQTHFFFLIKKEYSKYLFFYKNIICEINDEGRGKFKFLKIHENKNIND